MLMSYHTKTIHQTFKELDTTENGLAASEAEQRIRRYGPNLIRVVGEPLWRKLIEPFSNVFMVVLMVAIIISLFDHAYLDASIIGLIMAANAIIYYVQRFSTERILRTLSEHHKQTVEVRREGTSMNIDASMLVPGDVIVLNEGEKVPADARLITTAGVRVNESQLTGESLPVDKQTDPLEEDTEVYERTNMVFQGSFIISGEAIAVVAATGNDTEFGRLAGLAQASAGAKSPVQVKIDKLLSQIIVIVAIMASVAFGLSLLRGVELAESLRFMIALSVSAVPESLPVAISVVLVLAMRRMAAKNALVRSMSAIETIGAITTIATDKTGTLTKNKLSVQAVWQPADAPRDFTSVLAAAINFRKQKMHDPLDSAMSEYVLRKKATVTRHAPMTEFPFDHATSMSGNLRHRGKEYELAVKGAPEKVLERCELTEEERETAEATLHKMTREGFRVIAVAHTVLKRPIEDLNKLSRKDRLTFYGFVAVADILRPEAKRAIATAISAGVSVRMITGDHFETAFHIGKELGMVTSREQVFDTRRMHLMSDEELEETIEGTRIFSRVIPEHKYRILSLLKKRNITAMTGDGVNDVPALANADVGIAMGSGAHIAKDAGEIILLDDNFKSIVDAMHEGRTVTGNIRRMLYYLLATNAGEALTAIGALVAGMPVPLAPVQILWVNLVTDTCMVIPLGLEPGKARNMYERPRRVDAPILSKFMVSRLAFVAILMASVGLGIFSFFSMRYGYDYARTIAFNAMVVMQWASAMTARSDYESLLSRLRVVSMKFYLGLSIAIGLQIVALFGPLGRMLHVTPVAIGDLVITSAIAFTAPIILTEIHKFAGRRYFRKGSPARVAKLKAGVVY